jgi:hypothetical protein
MPARAEQVLCAPWLEAALALIQPAGLKRTSATAS